VPLPYLLKKPNKNYIILIGICSSLKEVTPKTDVGKIFLEKILENTISRFSQYETRNITRAATILDPRFKKFGFKNSSNSLSATSFVQSEITKIYQDYQKKDNILDEPSTSRANNEKNEPLINTDLFKNKNLFNYLQKKVSYKNTSIAPASGIVLLRQYLESENLPVEDDPLNYWKNQNNKYFTVLTNKYFCVPASSVPSERMFSKSGQLISEKRSKLKPKNVNMLLFLNFNQKLL